MNNNLQDPEKVQDIIAIVVLVAAGLYMFLYAPKLIPQMPFDQAKSLEPVKIDFVTLEKVNYSLFKEYDQVVITDEATKDYQRENPFAGRGVSAKEEAK